MPTPNTPAFLPFLHDTKAANTANYAMSQVRIIRDIPIHPSTITSPNNIIRMVQNTPTCRAIVINLQHGRTNPSITCLLEHSTDTTINSADSLLTALSSTITTFDISPTPSQLLHHTNPSPSPDKPPVTHRHPTTAVTPPPPAQTQHQRPPPFGSSLPAIVCQRPSNNRYHSLPNPAGGIANAGVYKGHYDTDTYRSITEHVSYPFNRSFPTEFQAMQHFQYFHPQCTTRAKILFLNYNAPMESSNMNNPSARLRQLIGTPTTTPRERTDFDTSTLEPFVILSRQAASRRMREQSLTPIDSYDFLPTDHPREFHSPTDLPIDHSLLPPDTFTTPTRPTGVPTLLSTNLATTIEDDNISQLSSHTQASLSFQPNPNPAPKRPRTILTSDRSISTTEHHATIAIANTIPPNYIALITPLLTTALDIATSITDANLPPISPNIYFAPNPTNHNTKITYLTATQPHHTTNIITLLNQLHPNSSPRVIPSIPHSATLPQTLDTTPPLHTSIPTNCRITQCPFYNNGFEETQPPNPQQLITDLHQHGIGLHFDTLNNTPTHLLNMIGWFRCGPSCPHLLFGLDMATEHRQNCANSHEHPPPNQLNASTIQPLPSQHTTDTNQHPPTPNEQEDEDEDIIDIDQHSSSSEDSNDHDRNVELSQTSLFDSCPSTRHHDLNTLISQNTSPAIINATILRWINESTNANTNDYNDDL